MDSFGTRTKKLLRAFLLLMAVAFLVFIISAVLHNVISGVLGAEEVVFFIIAVFVAPLALIVGLVGSIIVSIMKLLHGSR